MITKEQKILIAGANGMVGRALVRAFEKKGYQRLLVPKRVELNLLEQEKVHAYLQKNRPDCVIIAAAKVGGIIANSSFPASFLYENLMIASHLIHGSHLSDVKRLMFLGSTCIYPKFAPQPLREESLLTAPLEPTNEAYAIAKIAGVKLCQYYHEEYGRDYFAVMPTNLYGPNDNYHPTHSHVIPGLIRRFATAKKEGKEEVTIWGSGNALREFLHVDDLAEACLFLLEHLKGKTLINVGSDEEISILNLAKLIAKCLGFEGKIVCDLSKPDGTPRKKSDLSHLKALGWQAKQQLADGLFLTCQDFLAHHFENETFSMK